MALSGNLSDFDLSYIIQIVAQEGKTGKLIVRSPDLEGMIIFQKGKIIYAQTSLQNVDSLLTRYLIYTKNYAESEIQELKASHGNNINTLTYELILKKYCTPHELFSIVEICIVSFACELFFLKEGNYRFDSLENVNTFQIGSFSSSADSISMEAMRRVDDWERIRKEVNFDRLFIHSEQNAPPLKLSPIEQFTEYVYWLVDGNTSTKQICDYSFLPRYLVFEALFKLLKEQRIISVRFPTQKTKIASAKKNSFWIQNSTLFQTLGVSFVSGLVIVAILFFFFGYYNPVLFSDSLKSSNALHKELSCISSNNKIALAKLFYQAWYNQPPVSFSDLVTTGFVKTGDFSNILNRTTTEKK
jgi:hypothetical protein